MMKMKYWQRSDHVCTAKTVYISLAVEDDFCIDALRRGGEQND